MNPCAVLTPTLLSTGCHDQYDPDTDTGFSGANYFPDGLPRETFYEPTIGGYERAISERLRCWAQLRNNATVESDTDPDLNVTSKGHSDD